jgi:hypothetical protein
MIKRLLYDVYYVFVNNEQIRTSDIYSIFPNNCLSIKQHFL